MTTVVNSCPEVWFCNLTLHSWTFRRRNL